MSKDENCKIIPMCSFCGCFSTDAEYMIQGNIAFICSKCIVLCAAIAEDQDDSGKGYSLIEGRRHPLPTGKLRPITRLPKTWRICEENLYDSTPNIRAYSADRKKIEQFSIPKQLAYWMIKRGDETIDIDRIKEEVLEALRRNIRQALKF